jgi:hypothetical protein
VTWCGFAGSDGGGLGCYQPKVRGHERQRPSRRADGGHCRSRLKLSIRFSIPKFRRTRNLLQYRRRCRCWHWPVRILVHARRHYMRRRLWMRCKLGSHVLSRHPLRWRDNHNDHRVAGRIHTGHLHDLQYHQGAAGQPSRKSVDSGGCKLAAWALELCPWRDILRNSRWDAVSTIVVDRWHRSELCTILSHILTSLAWNRTLSRSA